MTTDTMPEVARSNWTASVTHRIELADGRVIYAHYAANTYDSEDFRLEVVTIDHRPTMESEEFRLAEHRMASEGFVPDVLPEWVRAIIDAADTPTPLTKD